MTLRCGKGLCWQLSGKEVKQRLGSLCEEGVNNSVVAGSVKGFAPCPQFFLGIVTSLDLEQHIYTRISHDDLDTCSQIAVVD